MNIIDIAIAKQLAGGGGGSGTDSYNDLSNLPKINDVTLSGNKSSSALGLQSEITSDSKLASDLVDDTNQDNKFVTSAEKTTWNGKQNAIDADHKINADYVDDSTSTNKFVTASDKETWNAKQNAIDNSHKLSSDLVDDANHTNKFVTSTEKQTWNAKQNAIDADHKLSSSLVSFSEAEAAAIASGIDSSKVGQISTNQTNILYGLQTGVKNLLTIKSTYTINGLTSVQQSDGYTVKITGTPTGGKSIQWSEVIKITESGTYKVKLTLSGTMASCYLYDITTQTLVHEYYSSNTYEETLTANHEYAMYTYSQSAIDATISAMLCTAAAYAQSTDFQPPALPNYDLTRLESEDRASLAEVVDSGAKNLFSDNNVGELINTTWNASTGTATQSNTDSQPNLRLKLQCRNGSSGSFTELFNNQIITSNGVVSFEFTCPTAATQLRFGHNGSQADATMVLTGFNLQANTKYYIQCNVINCVQASGAYSWNKIMVCTKAAFGVSSKFVPYRPNYDLVCQRSGAITKRNVTGTDWTLTDVSLTGSSGFVYFLSAGVDASGNYPTGILISTSNNSSDFMDASKLVCKNDDTRTTRMFSCSAIDMPYQSTTYYVWSKSTVSATNAVSLMWHKEPR